MDIIEDAGAYLLHLITQLWAEFMSRPVLYGVMVAIMIGLVVLAALLDGQNRLAQTRHDWEEINESRERLNEARGWENNR